MMAESSDLRMMEGPRGPQGSLRRKESNAKKESSTKKPLRIRKEFPETWLWTEETTRFV